MKNGYRIDWSEEAINNLDSIIDYLSSKWTNREIRNFYKLLDKKLVLISKNPNLFSYSELKLNVKRCVLSKQTTIYFEVNDHNIVILTLFDNRKNPKSIKI
jgi:plasmid stabilization system protein ParE